MSVAEATPDFEEGDRHDRAFLGHPKGLGYLSFVEACERFSYYSMQTLLTLYMVNYLLTPARMANVVAFDWLRSWHYTGLEGQPLSSAIFGDYSSLVYLTPILGGLIADRFSGRRAALMAGGLMMSLGHFLMAIESAFLLALMCLIIGVGLFKGNIASQVGALYKENDPRRAMAFQIFYIAINASVIIAPLISGTLGEKAGWHYGFGCAGVVMVLGVLLFLKGKAHLPADEDGKSINLSKTATALAIGSVASIVTIGIVFALGLVVMLLALIPLYFFLTSGLDRDEKIRVFALCILIPVMAVALLTNQQIFNAYLIWADQHFDRPLPSWLVGQRWDLYVLQIDFTNPFPTSWMIAIDAIASLAMLIAVAWFWKKVASRTGREPDELGKIIIGGFFTIAGGLCLYMAALTQGDGKISLFWPLMFHLLNSIGFAHILPVSLALFAKIAPQKINATVIGLYYLAFFSANKIAGRVGQLYSTMDTPTFWLLHVGSAVIGLVAFILFKMFASDRMTAAHAARATA